MNIKKLLFSLIILSSSKAYPIALNLEDSSSANRLKIIQAFAPEVHLDSREKFFPSSVHYFWTHCTLRTFQDPNPTSSMIPLPKSFGPAIARGEQITAALLGSYNQTNYPDQSFILWPFNTEDEGEARVRNEVLSPCYAHMKRTDNGSIIQYMFFYPFNSPTPFLGAVGKLADVGKKVIDTATETVEKAVQLEQQAEGSIRQFFGAGRPYPAQIKLSRVQKLNVGWHPGDWEHIDVYIKPEQKGGNDYVIDKVWYSRHALKDGRFDTFTTVGTHPVVYSAQYGHASYGYTISVMNRLADRANGQGARWYTWKNVVDVGTLNNPTAGNEWIRFKGRWGLVAAPSQQVWWLTK